MSLQDELHEQLDLFFSPSLASCVNFSQRKIELAIKTFGSIISSNGQWSNELEPTLDVDMFSQESHIAIDDILPAHGCEMRMPPFAELGLQDDESECPQEDKSLSSELECESTGYEFAPTVFLNSECGDEQSDASVALSSEEELSDEEFLQQLKEEVQDVEMMIWSQHFASENANLKEWLQDFRKRRREMRAALATQLNHNHGQTWVSANVERSKSNKR